MFVDIHTHICRQESPSVVSVQNLSPSDDLNTFPSLCSVGVHPWSISGMSDGEMERLHVAAKSPKVLMIGETGFDKLRCDASLELQEEVFLRHAEIAESVGKPLLIHCVKAFDQLIAAKRRLNPSQTWIVHGYRGKCQQAAQLLSQGFQLSFGPHFNEDSLRMAMQNDCAWLETDESDVPIEALYSSVSSLLQIPCSELQERLYERFASLTNQQLEF